MYLRRLLAINMASFAALGTVLLALGEQNSRLAVVAVLAALAAVWVTDILGVFRINRRITNVAVLLAVLRSLWELFQIHGSVQVIAIANLLAYVMIILLFQEKDFRTWWHIALLSLLQVAASATFFQDIWFAPLLLVYFFLGLSAVALLFLHNERTHYHQVRHHPILPRETRTVSDRLGINWRRLGKIVVATFVVGPVSLFLDYGEADGKTRAPLRPTPRDPGTGRWPLIHEEPEFTGSADKLGGRAGVGFEFYRHLAGLIPGTLVVAGVLFVMIPRMGRFDFSFSPYRGLSAAGDSTSLRKTGFSDTVQLGKEGNLTEDPEEVLQIKFLKPGSEQVYPTQGKIYLRGALLNNYDHGKWDYRAPAWRTTLSAMSTDDLPIEQDPRPGLVRQQVSIPGPERQELFCIWPFVAVHPDRRLSFDRAARKLLQTDQQERNPRPFELATYALVAGNQVSLIPNEIWDIMSEPGKQQLLQFERDDLAGLIAMADGWIEESGLDETQIVERARYLEARFTDSDQFAYSLQGQNREAGKDPVEDFVVNNRLGHCEYFATALALMLRSQGIPSRIVNGYVTSEYDSRKQFYRVRHRDAHSWVEAYVAPSSLPDELPFGRQDVDWQRGGWLRLDPTPSRMADTTFASLVDNVENFFEWMQSSWQTYVVQMDRSRQKEAIYEPLKSLAARLKQVLARGEGWRGFFQWVADLPRRLWKLLADAGWFSWIGLALLLSALGFGYVAYRIVLSIFRVVARLMPRGRRRSNRRASVAFYRRFESLLARQGLRRRPAQTQREFAVMAGHQLPVAGEELAESAATLVAEAFYEVRFGDGYLDSGRMQEVEQALDDLEIAASGRRLTDRSR